MHKCCLQEENLLQAMCISYARNSKCACTSAIQEENANTYALRLGIPKSRWACTSTASKNRIPMGKLPGSCIQHRVGNRSDCVRFTSSPGPDRQMSDPESSETDLGFKKSGHSRAQSGPEAVWRREIRYRPGLWPKFLERAKQKLLKGPRPVSSLAKAKFPLGKPRKQC